MSPQVLQYSGRMGLEPSRRLGHLPVQPVSRQYLMCKVSRSFPVFMVPTDSSVTLSTLKQCTMAETRPPISSVNKDWHHYVFWLRDTNTGSSSDTLSPKIEEFCASPSLDRHAHRQTASLSCPYLHFSFNQFRRVQTGFPVSYIHHFKHSQLCLFFPVFKGKWTINENWISNFSMN